MFGDFNCYTKAGANCNEDAIFYNKDMLIVMDGATSLKEVNCTSEASSACWLSKNTVSRLAAYLSSPGQNVLGAMKKVSEELKTELDSMGCSDDKKLYPSGSVMVARIVEDVLEIISIGDITAIIELNDKKEVLICDDSVTKLDNAILSQLEKWHKESGKCVLELIPQINERLIENRNKKNTEGGYWVFDPTGEAVDHAIVLRFNLTDIESIAIMSDGFYILSSFDEFSDNKKILKALKEIPAERLIDDIFNKLDNDASLNRYPRFKLKDDASVVFAKIK